LASASSQSKFVIAPLVVEGISFNKLQLNDILKQQMSDIKLTDIQLSRAGIFTLYAADVKSFNRLLNDLPTILTSNGQPAQSKVFVPRSIQRIKDTDKVAFVKRVDPEIPDDRIIEALKSIGLDATNVLRLTGKDGNTATRTVKVTFADVGNRNTFVHTGLQVDSMHFVAEAATQNTKPVQCYMCLQYNHVAKYCKTKQQVCARCGDSHRLDQCTAANDTFKCCNCNGNHLATSFECSKYKEQENKARNMVNQYASTSKPTPQAPALHSASEFLPLRSPLQSLQQQQLPTDFLEKIISALSSQMEKIIEETTSRLLSSFQQKIEQLEKAFFSRQQPQPQHTTTHQTNPKPKKATKVALSTTPKTTVPSVDTADYSTLSSDDEGSVSVVRHIREAQRRRTVSQGMDTTTTTSATTTAVVNTSKAKKKAKKQAAAAVAAVATTAVKRPISLNSSHDATTAVSKEQKTTDNNNA